MPTKWFLLIALAVVAGFAAVAMTAPAPRHPLAPLAGRVPTAGGWVPRPAAPPIAKPSPAGPAQVPPPRTGYRLPKIVLEDLDGRRVALSRYRGKVVLLHVFASWCDPCKEEMPELIRIAERLAGRDFVLLGVSTESADALRAAVAEHRLNYPILRDVGLPLRMAIGAETIPRTVIVDRDGTVVAHFRGYYGNIRPVHRALRTLGLPL